MNTSKALEIKRTETNFPYVEFKDWYDKDCKILASSLAEDRCIWVGLTDSHPELIVSNLESTDDGIVERYKVVPIELPDNINLSTKMLLNQEQVKKILPFLKKFAETGFID